MTGKLRKNKKNTYYKYFKAKLSTKFVFQYILAMMVTISRPKKVALIQQAA